MYVGCFNVESYLIKIVATNSAIVSVALVNTEFEENCNDIINEFKDQLSEYFNGSRKVFDIKYELNQLPFRTKLYNLITDIKFGEVVGAKSFLELMELKKGVNVIIRAMFDNPLIILIPCHRLSNPLRRLQAYNYSDDFRKYLLTIESEGN